MGYPDVPDAIIKLYPIVDADKPIIITQGYYDKLSETEKLSYIERID